MSTKRKRSIRSIQDKQSIILRFEKGEKETSLSSEYGVSKQIMKFADNLEIDHELKRKSLKVAHDEQLDEALYAWFIQQKTAGTPISGPLLQEKQSTFTVNYTRRTRTAKPSKLRQDGLSLQSGAPNENIAQNHLT